MEIYELNGQTEVSDAGLHVSGIVLLLDRIYFFFLLLVLEPGETGQQLIQYGKYQTANETMSIATNRQSLSVHCV